MKKYILTIDQGTTSSRAIIFDHDKNIVSVAQKEFKQYFQKPGWVEHDAHEIYLSVLSVMSEALNYGEIKPSQISAIGITNQRETTVIWDKKTGIPIYKAIVWQSRQSDTIVEKHKDKRQMIKDKTGLEIDAYFSATKIRWIFDNVEGAYEKAINNELLFGTIDTWLLWKLTDGKTHATDVSNASRTMLYNINTLKWDEELLELFDIPSCILPEVCPTSYNFGTTAPYHFFNHEVPIMALVGDQQAALFGQCCFEKGQVKMTYGTGGFLLMNTGDEIVKSKNGLVSTIAWKIEDQVQYASEGSIFVSGSLMQWLRDGIKIIDDVKYTSDMAYSVEDTNGVVIVPAFVGLGAPYWNDECYGSIFGLTRGTTKNHIVRAALEAIAYQTKDLLDALNKDFDVDITSLRVDGGAIKNEFLMQFQSDLLNISIEKIHTNETTALGAAYLAGLKSGFWQKEDLVPTVKKRYNPSNNCEKMMKLYKKWQLAIEVTQKFK